MPRRSTEVSEPMYFVLAALLDGPLHGNAIAGQVIALSCDRVRPSISTLYGILERLTAQGLLSIDREEVVSGRNRRYFRITDHGRAITAAEAERMHQAAGVVRGRLDPGRT
ncbi:PadR family transcriptional regulator [Nonomuraea sp. NPDC050310]|uniref:PadR family transcriptional regulator n=1 Tax=unclassified Nonomuraea TaxID=2593643 RepID=UPI0033CA4FFF